MSLLLALVFASSGAGAATQGGDVSAATGSVECRANSATSQAGDTGTATAAAFEQTGMGASTQGADSVTSRGIPSLAPLGVAFTPVAGAQVETWTPVEAETGIIWNLGG